MQVADGELVGVQGPSGCGKTTLLNLIGGIDRPTAGRIEVDGSNVVDFADGDLVKYRLAKVGFIFQFFNLVPTLTAEENVELPLRLAGERPPNPGGSREEVLQPGGVKQRGRHPPPQ